MLKKIGSILVALALVVTLIPATVAADSTKELVKTEHTVTSKGKTWQEVVNAFPENDANDKAKSRLKSCSNLLKAAGDNNYIENEDNNSSAMADWIKNDYTVSGYVSGQDLDYFAFYSDIDFKISLIVIADTSALRVGLSVQNQNDIFAAAECLGYDYDAGAYVYRLEASLTGGQYYDLVFLEINQSYCDYLFYFESTGKQFTDIYRVQGTDRYDTAFKTADELLYCYEKDQFDSVVVASGLDFPDALAGSYLACLEEAPILLTSSNDEHIARLKSYIRDNLKLGGTIYILGGKGVVPDKATSGLDKNYNLVRLDGLNRYETNMKILNKAGISGDEILVCTGADYPDSLSVAGLGLPIMLVGDSLSANQKNFVSQNGNCTFHIIGGTGVVSSKIESDLYRAGAYDVNRIYGNDRYLTSVKVADWFFTDHEAGVFAYGRNFPDGLCGGPLAYVLDAPLILSADGATQPAIDYSYNVTMSWGYVLGGPSLISDNSVLDIFWYDYDCIINVI